MYVINSLLWRRALQVKWALWKRERTSTWKEEKNLTCRFLRCQNMPCNKCSKSKTIGNFSCAIHHAIFSFINFCRIPCVWNALWKLRRRSRFLLRKIRWEKLSHMFSKYFWKILYFGNINKILDGTSENEVEGKKWHDFDWKSYIKKDWTKNDEQFSHS